MSLFEFVIAVQGDRSMTARVQIRAENAYIAQQLAHAQYGQANCITYRELSCE
jgi:hypothetical protein